MEETSRWFLPTHIKMEILDELWKTRHPDDAFFLNIIEGYVIKILNEFPNNIFYTKNDRLLFNYNTKTKFCFINDELIWQVYYKHYQLDIADIRILLKKMFDLHLNLRNTNPTFCMDYEYRCYDKKLKSKGKILIVNGR